MPTTNNIKLFKDGLDAEVSFLLILQSKLPRNYSIEHTDDPMCCVDYIMKIDGRLVMYLELKTRFLEKLKTYNSLMIGRIKLENIYRQLDKPTLIIWDCRAVGDLLYYKYFTDDLLEEKVFRLKTGKKVCFIGKALCATGFHELLDEIIS
jgi:hypothetical protein